MKLSALISHALLWVIGSSCVTAQCYQPSGRDLGPVATAIGDLVAGFERERSSQRGVQPNLLLVFHQSLDEMDRGPGVPNDVAANLERYLQEKRCPDIDRLKRALREASGNMNLVGEQHLAALRAVQERVEEVGADNIDPDTINELGVHDVNYLAYVGFRLALQEEDCLISAHLEADLDLLNVETGLVRSRSIGRFGGALNRGDDDTIVDFSVEADDLGRTLIISTRDLPVCYGDAEIKAWRDGGVGNYKEWTADLGCLGPNDEMEIDIPDEVTYKRAEFCITHEGCERACSDELALPPGKFTSGHALRNCGCWGYVPFGYSELNDECGSGYAGARACAGFCYGGSSPWALVCE